MPQQKSALVIILAPDATSSDALLKAISVAIDSVPPCDVDFVFIVHGTVEGMMIDRGSIGAAISNAAYAAAADAVDPPQKKIA